MALIETQDDYHVALNGIGLLLQGAPAAPAYRVGQAPLYNARFGQGDRSYSDFSFWWFWAQTSFLGYKQENIWEDDGLFSDSEGVDVTFDPGSVRLSYKQLGVGSVAKTTVMHAMGNSGGNTVLVGRNSTDQKMLAVLTDGSTFWEDTTVNASERILCTAELGDGDLYLGCRTLGSGASLLKKNAGVDVGSHSSGAGIYQMCAYPAGDSIYLFTSTAGLYVYNRSAGTFTQKKTTYPLGQGSACLPFVSTSTSGKQVWCIGDRIYFLTDKGVSTFTQLWAYDIGDDAYIPIISFPAGQCPTRLIEYNNVLYIFDPSAISGRLNVSKYDPASGEFSQLIELGRNAGTTTLVGSPVKDYTGVLFVVNDGTSDYQVWRMASDETFSSTLTPPSNFTTTINLIGVSQSGSFVFSKDGASGTNAIAVDDAAPQNDYQTTGYLITSNFDGNISAIDKLYNDAVLNFNALVSGQAIEVLYSINNGTTFTSLGTASFSVDGAIENKAFPFGSAIVSKKIMLKFILTGGGSNSPQLNDFALRYVPAINYTKSWDLRINAGDEVRRKSGALVNKVARELKGMLEKSWWTKSTLDFQDLDYAATAIDDGAGLSTSATTITVDDTKDFPEQGRLLIENEQILYTGKTPTTFTGCTRAARETRAAAHADNVVVSNAYKVIIVNMGETVPILLEEKNLEYIVDVSLREV